MELRTLQILCVDGDLATNCRIKAALGNASQPDYEVHSALSLHESYEALESRYFDVVLLDLELMGRLDQKTLNEFRRSNATIPVIALARPNLNSIAHRGLERGAQDYLPKDELSEPILTRAIRYAMQRQAAQTENKRLLGLVRANESLLHLKNQQIRKLNLTAHNFIDNVSHEFRTPLTVIKEYVALMRNGTLGQVNNEQTRFLRITEDRADDLNTTVDDMLDVSQLEAGVLAAHRCPNQFLDIAQGILPALQSKAEIQKLKLSFDIDPDSPAVFCDSEKIARVLINLAVNAMKYTPPGGRIHIWAQTQNTDLLVGVSDNGSGIAAEKLESIFERFEQGNVDVCSSTKGFGLGLSIANELVKLNLGEMNVKSELGEGTTFTFTIPQNEPIEVAQRFLNLLERDDLRFLSLISCQIDFDLLDGIAEDVEVFLRHLIGGNYLNLAIDSRSWIILVPEPTSEAELFIQNAHREREHVNSSRPQGPLPPIHYTIKKSWVDHPKYQSEILDCLRQHFQDFLFPSDVASLNADQTALKEVK